MILEGAFDGGGTAAFALNCTHANVQPFFRSGASFTAAHADNSGVFAMSDFDRGNFAPI